YRFDKGRADEDAGELGIGQTFDLEARLEAVHLAAVAVAPDFNVEQSESALALHRVRDLVGEHDHAGASGEHGQAMLDGAAQGLEQADALHEHRHRGALATWKHEPVEPFEVLASAHQPRSRAGFLERTN